MSIKHLLPKASASSLGKAMMRIDAQWGAMHKAALEQFAGINDSQQALLTYLHTESAYRCQVIEQLAIYTVSGEFACNDEWKTLVDGFNTRYEQAKKWYQEICHGVDHHDAINIETVTLQQNATVDFPTLQLKTAEAVEQARINQLISN